MSGRILSLGLWFALLLLSWPARAADLGEEETADRLLHQEALFHFHRNDYWRTLMLLENEHTGAVHLDNDYHNRNHLLAMEAGLRLGMTGLVREVAQHLEFTARDKPIKEQARFYQGKLAYYQQDWREALRQFNEVGTLLAQPLKEELAYYRANSFLAAGSAVDAAKALSGVGQKSLWGAHGYYNLGMHYLTREKSSAKALVALRVGVTMTDDSVEGRHLADRINVAAGQIALQGREYEKALSFLQEVRAGGVAAPLAILQYGQAQAGLGRQRTAIQTWYRAKKFALVLPGVADTFQTIAYAYDQEKLRATAIDAYLEAVSVYERELRQLEEIKSEIGKDGVLALLQKVRTDDSQVEWFLATDLATNTPRVAFVYYLMENDAFFERARTTLELDDARGEVQQGLQRLDALSSVLHQRQRQAPGANRRVAAVPGLDEATINGLIEQRNSLVKSLEALPVGPAKEAAALEIRSLDGELKALKRRYGQWRERHQDSRAFHAGQLTQAQGLSGQLRELSRDLDTEIAELDRGLTELATTLLDEHRDFIHDYYIRAQLALVNLYDDIAVAELEKSLDVQGAAGSKAGGS